MGNELQQVIDVIESTSPNTNAQAMGLLGMLFHSAPMPMLLCGYPDGEVLMSNRRANELYVTERSLNICSIVGLQAWQGLIDRLKDGGFVDEYEVLLGTAYGESFYSLLSAQLLRVGGATCILIGTSDITDRKRAEETMMKFFDSAPMLMMLARISDGAISRVNRRASELFLSSISDNLQFLDGIMGIVARTIFMDRLGHGGFTDNFEAELTTPYGEKFWANLSGQVMDVDNERCVLMGITDISDRKLSEDELRAAMTEAEQATKSKSLFLATMSHEIRTPMNGVLGMLDLLSNTSLTAEQSEMVRVIEDSAGTLLTIIDDILDVSKIESGKLHLERIPTNLAELLEGTLDLVSSRARDKGLEMAWILGESIPEFIYGDPVRLRQILLNLLGNAVKFTMQGHIALRATLTGSDDRFISIRFDVSDSGIGLTDEQKSRLFQPFSQADDSTTRRFGGTGLGLSICRRLVAMMGGDIGVDSAEGKGSCFWFEVPFEIADKKVANTQRLEGMTVLVVEDTGVTQRSIYNILTRFGANVIEVSTARELTSALSTAEVIDATLIDEDLMTSALFNRILQRVSHDRVLTLTNQVVPNGDHSKIAKPIHSQHLARVLNFVTGRSSEVYDKIAPAAHNIITPPSVEEAHLSGRLILVAEDNRTNQLVVGRQLTRLGYAYEMVENGEEAWEAQQKKAYGLLLTDCHMPMLDGYLLTKRIREAEITTGAHIPIVALTASALRDDAEKCLRSGMDDYLSKPIVIERLSEALKRWLPEKGPENGPENGDNKIAPTPDTIAQRLDSQIWEDDPQPKAEAGQPAVELDRLTEILGEDDPAVHLEMLQIFVECFDELQERMVGALAGQEWLELASTAHAAKGAARNAGAVQLGDTLFTLEKTAPQGNKPDLEMLVQQVDDLFADVAAFVRQLGEQQAAG